MVAARIFRGLESKQTRACAAHDSAPLMLSRSSDGFINGKVVFYNGPTLLRIVRMSGLFFVGYCQDGFYS